MRRDFEIEETKASSAASIPDSSTSSNPFSQNTRELMKKIQMLERQNKDKDSKIMKLSRDNDSLKARNRVLEAQLKKKKTEESKGKKKITGSGMGGMSAAPFSRLDKKVSGKFI